MDFYPETHVPFPVYVPAPPSLQYCVMNTQPTIVAPRLILVHAVRSWLLSHDTTLFDIHSLQLIDEKINTFLDIVTTVLHTFNLPSYMIFPAVVYAHKYVCKQGVQGDQVFHLLLASAMTTIKFWDDTASGVNQTIATTFNYSIQSVNNVERSFLNGIGWELTLHWEEVETFAMQISDYLQSIHTISALQQLQNSNNNPILYVSSPSYLSSPPTLPLHLQGSPYNIYSSNTSVVVPPVVYCYAAH